MIDRPTDTQRIDLLERAMGRAGLIEGDEDGRLTVRAEERDLFRAAAVIDHTIRLQQGDINRNSRELAKLGARSQEQGSLLGEVAEGARSMAGRVSDHHGKIKSLGDQLAILENKHNTERENRQRQVDHILTLLEERRDAWPRLRRAAARVVYAAARVVYAAARVVYAVAGWLDDAAQRMER